MINTMTKRILGALIISFAAAQAAQACATCDLHSKKETKAKAAEHKHEAGVEHNHEAAAEPEAVEAKKAKAKRIKVTGSFVQAKKGVQFKTDDGKIYKLNKKQAEAVAENIGKPVNLVASVKKGKDKKSERLVKIIKITPVEAVANQAEDE